MLSSIPSCEILSQMKKKTHTHFCVFTREQQLADKVLGSLLQLIQTRFNLYQNFRRQRPSQTANRRRHSYIGIPTLIGENKSNSIGLLVRRSAEQTARWLILNDGKHSSGSWWLGKVSARLITGLCFRCVGSSVAFPPADPCLFPFNAFAPNKRLNWR